MDQLRPILVPLEHPHLYCIRMKGLSLIFSMQRIVVIRNRKNAPVFHDEQFVRLIVFMEWKGELLRVSIHLEAMMEHDNFCREVESPAKNSVTIHDVWPHARGIATVPAAGLSEYFSRTLDFSKIMERTREEEWFLFMVKEPSDITAE
jgi:hypothetical protein